jgi:hypothetical protein
MEIVLTILCGLVAVAGAVGLFWLQLFLDTQRRIYQSRRILRGLENDKKARDQSVAAAKEHSAPPEARRQQAEGIKPGCVRVQKQDPA